MTLGADGWGKEVKRTGRWTFNIMNPMAINAGGDIRISLANQGCPMNAFFVNAVDLGVAFLAGLGDFASRFIGWADTVGAMTVRANGGLKISSCQGLIVDAVERGLILVSMTVCTRCIQLEGKCTARGSRTFRVWKTSNVGVALNTCVSQFSMYRVIVRFSLNCQ